jgi:hypothetical protein
VHTRDQQDGERSKTVERTPMAERWRENVDGRHCGDVTRQRIDESRVTAASLRWLG